MSPLLVALALTTATTAGLTAYAAHHQRSWVARGITSAVAFPVLATCQALLALGAAAALAPGYGAVVAVSAAAACWLGVLAITTDLTCRMIPREIAHPVAAIGAVCALVTSIGTNGITTWLSLGTAVLGLVLIPWVARVMTRGGLGFSDIRLLWALTATLSWWVGPSLMIYALIAAALAQALVRVVAGPLRLGTLVSASPATVSPGSNPAQRSARPRRELPFAPAIVLAFAVTTAYSAATGLGACQDWAPLSGC